MRAISLWQPWASAVAVNAKRVETRHWATPYRGALAIHAAQRKVVLELMHYGSCWNWAGALRPANSPANTSHWPDLTLLPFGAIVAVCNLVECRPTDSFTNAELDAPRLPPGETLDSYQWTERQMGNFELGRFGWVLEDIRMLREPVPFKGHQGFFNVPDSLLNFHEEH